MWRPQLLAGLGVALVCAGGAYAQSQAEPNHARRSRVVARVNERSITVSDVEDSINARSPFLRTKYRSRKGSRALVEEMIHFELLVLAAEKFGYDKRPEVTGAAKEEAVQQLIRQEVDSRIAPETVAAEEVERYYKEHTDEFSQPATVRASWILVASEAKARRLAKLARRADVRAFRRLAREHSKDSVTRLRGGDLGYFDAAGKPPTSEEAVTSQPVAAAVFKLREVGDVSNPIQVEKSWALVKLTGKRPEQGVTLEEAEPRVRRTIWRESRRHAVEAFVRQLDGQYKPRIYEERAAGIELKGTDPETP